jgi:hypothetical protein
LAGEAFASPPEQNMPNRTAKFLSTVVAGCLAGAALTGVSHGATPAPAADECLSGPSKDPTPSGSHWYYRIDRATKRHCWYVGPQRDARAQITPSNAASITPSKVSPSAAPKAQATVSGTVADARAELTASQTRGTQEANATGPVPSAAPADATDVTSSAPASAGNADMQGSQISARWPDQSAANSFDAPEPATDNSKAPPEPALAAPPPPATLLAPADAPSEKQSGSIQMLLIVMAGALALAGLVGSAIVRFGGRGRTDDREIEDDRSTMWDTVRADHQSRPVFQHQVAPKLATPKLATRHPGELRAGGAPRATNAPAPRAAGTPRTANAPRAAGAPRPASRPAGAPDDKIAEMLARLARSAQT